MAKQATAQAKNLKCVWLLTIIIHYLVVLATTMAPDVRLGIKFISFVNHSMKNQCLH